MTDAAGPAEAAQIVAVMRATLRGGRRAPVPVELAGVEGLEELLEELVGLYRFALAMSQGDLDESPSSKGSMTGASTSWVTSRTPSTTWSSHSKN
jgi:hypothetical protein